MPRKNEPTERQCLVTRTVRPVSALIRFVQDPDGRVVADLKGKLPGRGVWVTATRKAVTQAQAKRLFAKGFKADAPADPALPDQVEALLEQAALGAIAMARKAGLVVTGFAKVEAALAGRAALAGLIHAADASDDGIRKLSGAAVRARSEQGGSGSGPAVIREFTTAQLDLAMGRSNVVHAALLSGGAAQNVLERVRALRVYRSEEAGIGDDPGADDAVDEDGSNRGEPLDDGAIADRGFGTTGDDRPAGLE